VSATLVEEAMKTRVLTVLLLLAGALVLAFFSAHAQIDEQDSCRISCRAALSECLTRCGSHSDPIECEDGCQSGAQECESACP
jgi:hypothetical protein